MNKIEEARKYLKSNQLYLYNIDALTGDEYYKAVRIMNKMKYLKEDEREIIERIYVKKIDNYRSCAMKLRISVPTLYRRLSKAITTLSYFV